MNIFKTIFGNSGSKNNTVTIGGVKIEGDFNSVEMRNGKIYVDGNLYKGGDYTGSTVKVEIHGDVEKLEANGSVEVRGNVGKSVNSGGSTKIGGQVGGNVSSGGSSVVNGKVLGNVSAGGSLVVNG